MSGKGRQQIEVDESQFFAQLLEAGWQRWLYAVSEAKQVTHYGNRDEN